MARKMCESCGMPLKDETKGTEKDGSPSDRYCNLCYGEGKFHDPGMTAEQMMEISRKALKDKGLPNFLAKLMVKKTPKLPRWSK